jgi:hypothetical protein
VTETDVAGAPYREIVPDRILVDASFSALTSNFNWMLERNGDPGGHAMLLAMLQFIGIQAAQLEVKSRAIPTPPFETFAESWSATIREQYRMTIAELRRADVRGGPVDMPAAVGGSRIDRQIAAPEPITEQLWVPEVRGDGVHLVGADDKSTVLRLCRPDHGSDLLIAGYIAGLQAKALKEDGR